jgi:hypothetical protein
MLVSAPAFCTVDGEFQPFWLRVQDQAVESYTMREVFDMESSVRVEAIENLGKDHNLLLRLFLTQGMAAACCLSQMAGNIIIFAPAYFFWFRHNHGNTTAMYMAQNQQQITPAYRELM